MCENKVERYARDQWGECVLWQKCYLWIVYCGSISVMAVPLQGLNERWYDEIM